MHALHYANELLVRARLSFQKLLQTRLICRNNKKKCLGKSNDAYSLSITVQTTINHISICFLPQYQRQRKCFSERELKKALRDKLTRAALYVIYSNKLANQVARLAAIVVKKDLCCSNVSMLCYKTSCKRHSMYYWVMDVLWRFAKHSCASFVLSNLPRASITQ